jgi:hypothetical protein
MILSQNTGQVSWTIPFKCYLKQHSSTEIPPNRAVSLIQIVEPAPTQVNGALFVAELM